MESNKNDNNNGIDNKHEQPQRSAQKRKSNQLTNDEDKPAGEEDQPEPDECSSSKKNRDEGNDLVDLEVESLSREELINLVRKQMTTTMEAQKQLETAKKEADVSASRQAEEFCQRIVQMEQEKTEVHGDMRKKLAEIVEIHNEVEEKSKMMAEKAKQIDALLMRVVSRSSSCSSTNLQVISTKCQQNKE